MECSQYTSFHESYQDMHDESSNLLRDEVDQLQVRIAAEGTVLSSMDCGPESKWSWLQRRTSRDA